MKIKVLLIIGIIIFKCSPKNKDNYYTYDDNEVLSKINLILNESAPEYKMILEQGFSNKLNGKTVGYTIHDLTNPDNINMFDSHKSRRIKFLDKHFYHFSPIIKSMSYSHILFLEGGEMKFFKFINCSNKGDDLIDVLKFAQEKLKDLKNKDEIINNIKNYRDYGYYHVEDNYGSSVLCD